MAVKNYYYIISIFLITAPLAYKVSKMTLPAYGIMFVCLVGIFIRTLIIKQKNNPNKKNKSSWVKNEDFEALELSVLKEIPSHSDVISQIINSLKKFSKKNIFKNYLGFNFLLGEENQGKKDVIFSLLNHCKSDVQVKVFYGGLCNSSNVKSYFEDLYHFIERSKNPVVIFVDIEKLPDMALEILIDSLSRGVIEHSKENPAPLNNTLFFALLDISVDKYIAAEKDLEKILRNSNIPSSLISKNSLISYIKTFETNEVAEQVLFELTRIWEKNGITINRVAPEIIFDLLMKMNENEKNNIEYIRNWILKNHSVYIEKLKSEKVDRVSLGGANSEFLKIEIIKDGI